ncbi:MAG: hypothetical protein JWQ89_2013 [Devosia sp.]|uniref:hypothetical protein n=1 Tax=Devosia sp. TaxID=1871048 RepID=UPI002627F14E|nr:hypothetical protein [Devosia sp.]MDB5540286.1 hypothetical protein [Devosia sp.]
MLTWPAIPIIVEAGIWVGGSVRLFGPGGHALLEAKHVRRLRDEKSATPEAANSLTKALRQVFAMAWR